MGQGEALRKTEHKGMMCQRCVRVAGGGGVQGGERKRERKTKDTKTGLDFSSDYSWWKLYKSSSILLFVRGSSGFTNLVLYGETAHNQSFHSYLV